MFRSRLLIKNNCLCMCMCVYVCVYVCVCVCVCVCVLNSVGTLLRKQFFFSIFLVAKIVMFYLLFIYYNSLLYDQVLLAQIWTILPWKITKKIFHCFPYNCGRKPVLLVIFPVSCYFPQGPYVLSFNIHQSAASLHLSTCCMY